MVFQIYPTTQTFDAKDPNDVDVFVVDFSAILSEYNDTISSVSGVSVSPSGSLSAYDILSIGNNTQVSFYASGGINGIIYEVDTTIVTNLMPSGRVINRTVLLPVLTR